MSRKVDAVFFDMGGVLLSPGSPHRRDQWCDRLGISPHGLGECVSNAVGGGWAAGLTPTLILSRLAERLEIGETEDDEFLLDWHSAERLDPLLMEFVDRRGDIVVGVVSNNGPDVRRYWNQLHGLDRHFQPVVISGEERVSKPDPRIFQIASTRAGCDLGRCVLIDDSPKNVDGARAAGAHGIHHIDSVSTIEQLHALIAP